MPRSDEAQAFFHAVYSAVQEIPHGKVTTYGHIAMLLKDLVRSQPGGSRSQADALQAEGVQVETNAMGEHSVDFSQYGWFPDLLPSEENDQGE
ncbi:MGMT family [Fusarium coicis]|nr:MGMT family [Fusarium coicis]